MNANQQVNDLLASIDANRKALANVSEYSFKGHPVRIVMRDGEPWFVCTDVAEALGYATAKDAARNLSAQHKGGQIVPTPGGNQELTVISEGGLYRLVLRSRKPEAVAFCDWVTDEVLPSIRKTGSYNAQPALPRNPDGIYSIDLDTLPGNHWLVSIQGSRLVIRESRKGDRLVNPNNDLAMGVFLTFASTEQLQRAIVTATKELTKRAHGEKGADELMEESINRSRAA